MKRWPFPTLLLLAVALAACAVAPIGEQPATPADAPRETAMPRSFEPVGPLPSDAGDEGGVNKRAGEVPAQLLAQIRADAADRTGTPPGRIEVLEATSVTWRDGSLGCPERGMMYTMALVPGYHVVLRAGDEELDYRATAAGAFRLCIAPAPGGTADTTS